MSTGKKSIDTLLQEINSDLPADSRARALIELRMHDNIRSSQLSQSIKEILTSALHANYETSIRVEVIMTLAFIFEEEILPLLLRLCNDDDPRIRSSVVAAMGYVGIYDVSVERFLARCLLDPIADIRDRAARALGRLGATEKINDLCKIATRDPSNMVRAGAIVSLGMLGSPILVRYALEILDLPETPPEIIYAMKDYLEQIKEL